MTSYQGHTPATLTGETAERFRTYRSLGLSEAGALRQAVDDNLREDNARRMERLVGSWSGRAVSEAQVELAASEARRNDPVESMLRVHEAWDPQPGSPLEKRARARRAVERRYGSLDEARASFTPTSPTVGAGRTDAEWARVHEAARTAGVIRPGERAWGNDAVTAFNRQVAAVEARGISLDLALAETTRAVRAGDVQLRETPTPAPGPVSERAPAPVADPPPPTRTDDELREANAARMDALLGINREDDR